MLRAAGREILNFLTDAEASVVTEHALLLSLIAMAIFAALSTFGSTVSGSLYTASIALLPFGS